MVKVTLNGRLTSDPKVLYSRENKQTAVANFSVACNIGKDETLFLSCSAFRNRAEFIGKYFTKGSPIILSGNLKPNKYTTRNNISVDSVQLIVTDFVFSCY